QTIPEKPASVDRHNSAPLVCRRTNPFAPKHVVTNRKVSRSDRSPKTRPRPRRFTIRKKQKARQILADLSGYLAGAGPATSMVRRMLRYSRNSEKLIIFGTVLQ